MVRIDRRLPSSSATMVLLIVLVGIVGVALVLSTTSILREGLSLNPADGSTGKRDPPSLTRALRETVVDNTSLLTPNDPSDYLILITATCSGYMDWQSLAAYEKAKEVWPEAEFVRLLHCSNDDRVKYKYKDIAPSMYTTDCSCHTRYKDCYPPLNRPIALKEFFDRRPSRTIKQKWIVIMDSDTLLRKRMNYVPVYKNRPVGQEARVLMDKMYTAGKFVFGDHASTVARPLYDIGSPYILHKEDAERLAPHWVRITNDLREDATMREYLGWIVEMYSYVLAAAYVGLDHHVRSDLQTRYPFTDTDLDVASYHYDLDHDMGGHRWSKRDYMNDIIDSDVLMKTSDAPNEHILYILESINTALTKWRRANRST